MGGRGKRTDGRQPVPREEQPPIPLEPVDLLAGIAPGVVLHADEAIDAEDAESGEVTVGDVGRMLRSGDATIRRLIRTAGIRPTEPAPPAAAPREVMRAGVPPRTRDKPGE